MAGAALKQETYLPEADAQVAGKADRRFQDARSAGSADGGGAGARAGWGASGRS